MQHNRGIKDGFKQFFLVDAFVLRKLPLPKMATRRPGPGVLQSLGEQRARRARADTNKKPPSRAPATLWPTSTAPCGHKRPPQKRVFQGSASPCPSSCRFHRVAGQNSSSAATES